MSAKRTILNRLAEDDLKKVLQGLLSLAENYQDEQLRNDATFQSGRLNALEKQRMNGTISQEEDHLQTARIREALLQIVQGLPDDWTLDRTDGPPTFHPASSKMNWKKYVAYFMAAVALLTGIAELTGYSIRDIFQKRAPTEIPAEVQPPAPKADTKGDNSPAVITDDGDVNINYGAPESQRDSTRSPKPSQ